MKILSRLLMISTDVVEHMISISLSAEAVNHD